jgi:hypothetical protein
MDINSLQQAMAPLLEIGKSETQFEVEGYVICMRPLLPVEEVSVQRYAASILDQVQQAEGLTNDDQMSRAAALDYFDRFRIEVISHAVVEVNGLSLRGIKTIETGEVLDNGTKVKVPKPIAMRQMVENWSRAMLTVCFSKYGDMVKEIADRAEKMVEKSNSDLEAEIERMESRLENLKRERGTRASGDPAIISNQVQNLVQAGEIMKKQVEAASEQVRRQSVIPESSSPPTSGSQPVGSFFDPTVEEVADAEVPDLAAEADRLSEARRAALSGKDLMSQAKKVGQIEGVDAYRLPSVDMSPRGKKSNPKKDSKVDKADPRKGTENPNFKPR